jgi:peptide/nickel transport system permease protein
VLVFIVRRLAYAILTIVAVSLIAFFIIELAPGSAITQEISRLRAHGNVVSVQQIAAMEEQYGINDPWIVKYWKWASGLLHGQMGQSFLYHEPVANLIGSRLALSVTLSFGAIIVAWAIAIPIGVYSATHRYTIPDYVVTVIQFVGVAIPEFLLALGVMTAAVRWFGVEVGGLYSNEFRNAPWSMARFGDLLGHLWMPLAVIAVGSTAWLTRVMRANLFDVLGQQYVQTARAKGVPERKVIWKHAVRNALHPLVMTFGTTLSALISGEAIVSIVFALPTTGQALVQTLISKDTYVAATLLTLLSILLVIGNLISDLLLAWIDPRVKVTD